MSFILRQITKRVGAPDIVREKQLAAAEPVIGRGSDCDIQLTDLAVSLRHAVVKQTAPGKVSVDSLGGENFEADGKFVHNVVLNLASSPVLMFGSHVLTLTPGENGDILITATARENTAAADTASEQKQSFSLKYALFSQRQVAWITTVAILVACLIAPIGLFVIDHNRHQMISSAADRQWSSGPLSPGHHFLEKNCEACHARAFVSVTDGACLSCHQADLNRSARAQVASLTQNLGSPFPPDPAADHAPHDRLMAAAPPDPNLARRINSWVANTFSHPNNRCASCHTEHVGTGQAETGKRPVPVTENELKRNDCKDCHTGMSQRLPDTKIPDVPDWGHHPDFRPVITVGFNGDKPVLQKAALSSTPAEKEGLIFGHDVHLSATDGVARQAVELGKAAGYGAPLTCDNCHKRADDGGFVPIEMKRDCGACHSLAFTRKNGMDQLLPHGHPDQVVAALRAYFANQPRQSGAPEAFLGRPGMHGVFMPSQPVDYVAANVRDAFEPGGTCYGCHVIIPPADKRSLNYRVAPVKLTSRYLPWGDFNHNIPEHHQDSGGQPNCDSCHKVKNSTKAEDVMLPRIAECGTCHGKTRQETQTAAGSDCAECHGFHNPGQVTSPRNQQLARSALIRIQ
ncbi:MAG TPA: FHA domain-containing protein [Rhizomicrobium sp.]|jgi:pSer/pThr/pTyr-binding forkhead associated (FHA) protein